MSKTRGMHRVHSTTMGFDRVPVLVLVSVAAILVMPLLAPLAASATEHAGEPVNLNLEDADFRDVLQTFGMLADLRVAIDPRAVATGTLDNPLTLLAQDKPWDEVLQAILASRGLSTIREGTLLWVLPAGETMPGDRSFTGEPINLNLRDADLLDVLDSFAKIGEIRITSEPEVGGMVNLTITDTPWDQVLDLMIRIAGYGYTKDGDEITVHLIPGGTTGELLPSGWPEHQARSLSGSGETPHRYTVGGPISEPKRISGPDPVYPAELKAAGTTGIVVLQVVIDTAGKVQSLTPVDSSAPQAMVEAASKAVRQWRFTPATMNGETVTAEYILTVRFKPEQQ